MPMLQILNVPSMEVVMDSIFPLQQQLLTSNQGDIRYVTLWIPLILGVKVLHLVFITWARVVCLICTPRSQRAEGAHIR